MLALPLEMIYQVHRYLDIDSRRNLEFALGWRRGSIVYPLPKVSYEEEGDFVEKKMQITDLEYDDDYFDQVLLSIRFPVSEKAEYEIDTFIRNSWTRVKDMTWRITDKWIRRGGWKGQEKKGTEVNVYYYPPHRYRGAHLMWMAKEDHFRDIDGRSYHIEEVQMIRNDCKGNEAYMIPWKAIEIRRYRTEIDWAEIMSGECR